jgi:hypothetical protein
MNKGLLKFAAYCIVIVGINLGLALIFKFNDLLFGCVIIAISVLFCGYTVYVTKVVPYMQFRKTMISQLNSLNFEKLLDRDEIKWVQKILRATPVNSDIICLIRESYRRQMEEETVYVISYANSGQSINDGFCILHISNQLVRSGGAAIGRNQKWNVNSAMKQDLWDKISGNIKGCVSYYCEDGFLVTYTDVAQLDQLYCINELFYDHSIIFQALGE